ncbi:MAG: hypothetical protein ABSG84_09785 [Acidobacteriaceae bacterium]|jgi:hypothetical protein
MFDLVSGTIGSRRIIIPHCTDPLIGNILAGWRYDISGLSPAMRTDYDQHLSDCAHCRRRQHVARSIDVLLISVSSLSILAFLLAAAVLHRIEALAHLSNTLHGHFHHTPITISLEAAAIAGLVISLLLWVLVAIATPIPGLFADALQQRIPPHIRERIMKNAA